MSRRALSAFAAVSVLWGMPYLFIKIAVDDGMAPVLVAWSRIVLGAVILLALAWRAGTLHTLRGRMRTVALFAVAEIAIPFPLIGIGEQRVPSSLAAIVIAATPLIVALLALRFDEAERVDRSRLAGLLLGFGGVVALVGIDVAGSASALLGTGAILLASVGYAVGPMLLNRRLSGHDPRAVMGAALGIAALALAAPALASIPSSAVTTDALVAVALLGVLCTAMAFALYGVLIAEIGPGRALVITYVAPIVAVALGVAVLGETVGPGAVAGLLLILAGSWLSTRPPGARTPVRRASRPPDQVSSRTWARRRSPTTRRASAAPASRS